MPDLTTPDPAPPSPPMIQGATGGQEPFDRAYPKPLRDREYAIVQRRRKPGNVSGDSRPAGLLGCGLSGGGIRSATFSLGVFQAMALRPGLLGKIDFLSTVSGGGYFGAFLGRLFSRDYIEQASDVEEVLKGSSSKPPVLGFLRENARYLSPNGAGDELLAGASVLRNLVSIHLVLAVFLLTFFLAIQTLRIGVELSLKGIADLNRWLSHGAFWGSPYLVLPLVLFLLAVVPLGWAYWLIRPERRTIEKEPATITPWAGLFMAAVLALFLIPSYWGPTLPWAAGAVLAVTMATFLWRGAVWLKFLFTGLKPSASSKDVQPGANRAARDVREVAAQDSVPAVESVASSTRRNFRSKLFEPRDLETKLYLNRWIPNRLALWLSWALAVTAGLLALALIDSLGQSLYVLLQHHELLAKALTGLVSAIATLLGFARRIAAFFSGGSAGKRPSMPLQWLAAVGALLVVTVLLVGLDALSHAIVWRFESPVGAPAAAGSQEPNKVTVQVQADREIIPPLNALNVRMKIEGASNPKTTKPDMTQQERQRRRRLVPAAVGLISGLLLSLLFGQTWSFLNKSSFHPMYSDRLTRAYLGASNPDRLRDDCPSLTEPVKGDDEDLAGYWPPPQKKGTFLHLINVTINETIDGRSQIQQQDRKGLGMALGPCGLSAGVQHHMLLPFGEPENTDPFGAPVTVFPRQGFRIFDYQDDRFAGEMLPLGSWVGISGAAFSTGSGMNTSLGLSLLAGLGNVRLGRWWDSGVLRSKTSRKLGLRIEDFLSRVFPVQVYLVDELLARFPGTARRHWYLSDGGHFENMGGYELVRRRLDQIVIVDGEQDQDYAFEGLANLIRKARLDFGADITFLDEKHLDKQIKGSARSAFGTLEQLRPGKWQEEEKTPGGGRQGKLLEADPAGLSQAHAALARITYSAGSGPSESWLVYIKPTLTGDEPGDVVEYHRNHPAFPHESTLDQFFDEAQWESYRKLGQHITAQISEFLQAYL
jgi:hypothetical protein